MSDQQQTTLCGDPDQDADTGFFCRNFYRCGIGNYCTNFAVSSRSVRQILTKLFRRRGGMMSRRLIWCCSGSRSRSGNFKTEFLPLGDRRIVRVLRPRRPRRRFSVSDSFKSVIYDCDVV